MVCHVMDTDATGPGEEKPEGHLVAHVKVGHAAAVLVQGVVSQTNDFNMYLGQELTQGSLLSRDSSAPVVSRGVRPQQQPSDGRGLILSA